MKVRIVETVNVDVEAWALEYGIDKKEVRDDVKAYFKYWIQEHIDGLDMVTVENDK